MESSRHDSRPTAPAVPSSARPWLVVGLLLFLAAVSSFPGPDHGQYLKWSAAIRHADVGQLANSLDLVSVKGVPFSTWAAGPGLFIAPFGFVMEPLGLGQGAGLMAGYVAAGFFWFCFYVALRRLACQWLAVLGCVLAYVATPLGFYSIALSSEVFGMAVSGYLLLQTVSAVQNRPVQLWGTAAATGLLLLFRSYFGVFAWPALFVILLREWQRPDSRRSAWRFMGLVGLVLVVVALQIGSVNYWMTGNAWHSAYAFGDEHFRSFDKTSPFLTHVLFDSFHGLLPTHPLVIVCHLCAAALAVVSFRRKQYLETIMWGFYLTAFLLNAYVQGCYYYWWSAVGSLGVRGLVLTGIGATAAWVRTASLLQSSETRLGLAAFRALLSVTGTLALWSWIHLSIGPGDYVSYWDMLRWFGEELSGWCNAAGLLSLVSSFIIVTVLVKPTRSPRALVAWTGAVLATLAVASHLRYLRIEPPHHNFIIISAAVLGVFLITNGIRAELLERALPGSLVVSLITMLVLFARLAIPTFGQLSDAQIAGPVYNYPDARDAYLTLVQMPRFADQQAALYSFFERTQSEEWLASLPPENSGGVLVELNFYTYRRRPKLSELPRIFHEAQLADIPEKSP